MLTRERTIRSGGLRVTHVVLSLDVGGLERNVVNQVREGKNLGQQVSVVCLRAPGALASKVADLGARLLSLDKSPGLRLEIIPRMWRALRNLRPDVVHTHQLATLLYGGAAARLLRVPVVVHTEHGQERYASRLRTRLLGRIAGKWCDHFYCLTSDMARQVRNARIVPDTKIKVICNGIDISKFSGVSHDTTAVRRALGIPPHAPLIGTVGRLSEIKRQDVLIRAFARVRQCVPETHLVLIGDGPMMEDLRGLARGLGLGDAVHFAGYQEHSGPYLQAMDIFALTSRSEGMPQAVLEAAVTGLPVVASRVGGLPEVIQDGVTGVLFEVGDDGELAKALCNILAHPDQGRRMGIAAKARVESMFSVSRMAWEYQRDALCLLRQARQPEAEAAIPAGAHPIAEGCP